MPLVLTAARLRRQAPRLFSLGALAATVVMLLTLVFAPSDAFAQRKKCLDCHKDFKKELKKKVRHEPADEEGCLTCHDRHGFSQELVLQKAMPELCIDCHENLTAEIESPHAHEALARGGCSVCHNPHGSDNKALLRETEQGKTVCLVCHQGLSELLGSKDAHDPFRKADCEACHAPHASDKPHLLVDTQTAVCESCHRGALGKHKFAGAADFDCSDCHDPHAVSKKTELAAYAHEPFVGGECDACHTIEDDEVTLGDDFPAGDMCADCHDGPASAMGGETSHFGIDDLKTGGTSTCLECHSPHSARVDGLLQGTQIEVCSKCHEGPPDPMKFGGPIHAPFGAGDCTACHTPHGGGGEHHLTQELGSLCSSCHEGITAPAQEGQTVHEALDVIECTECHKPHTSRFPKLLAMLPQEKCADCHDKDSFGVTHSPYGDGNCAECHSNHARSKGLLFAEVKEVCTRCHRGIAQNMEAEFAHSPVQEESCLSCHESHGGDHKGLLTERQDELCYTCHDLEDLVVAASPPAGDSGADVASAVKLHAPVADGDCAGCHNPHGSPIDKLLSRNERDICYNCHAEERISFAEGNVHQPLIDSACSICHASHGSPNLALRNAAEPGLCTQCHNFAEPPLYGGHMGFDVSQSQCTSCHNPHNAKNDNIINPVVHEPYADGDCETCHSGPKAGNVIASVEATLCFDCHDEKEEGIGHQHTGDVACVDCHTPHTSKYETLLDNPATLCTKCHRDVLEAKVGEGQTVTLHQPIADGSCLDCHQIHDPTSSENFLVESQRNLCSNCHESMKARVSHATQHDPFKKGKCESCHTTHAAADRRMLKKDEEKLCKTCHRLGTAEMAKAHGNMELSGEGCSTCHDPHSTDRAASALLLPVLHSPYEDGDCSACHTQGSATKQSLSMCLDCHEEHNNYSTVHKAGRAGAQANDVGICLDCHSPHAGEGKVFRRRSEAETCYQCHERKEFTRQSVHAAIDDGCATCHDVHQNNTSELKGVAVNDLCAQCHEAAQMHVHPVGGEHKDPRTNGPLLCTSCHEVHSSDHDYILTFDFRRDLCVQCHAAGTMKVR